LIVVLDCVFSARRFGVVLLENHNLTYLP
jgi:hypothetical protein